MSATSPISHPIHDTASDIRAAGCLLLSWMVTTGFMWGFAFFHLPSASPEWLTRAQVACFGVDETGLPDTFGWMLLILAPVSLLIALMSALGREMLASVRSTMNFGAGRVVVYFLCLGIFAESIWIGSRIQAGLGARSRNDVALKTEALPEGYARTSRVASPFQLVDQNGESVSLERFSGSPLILTFAFAHCHTICPFIVKNAKDAMARSGMEEAHLVVITLDPWRDTPGALASQARTWDFGSREHFVSGPVHEVDGTLERYGVPRQRDEKTGDIVHPALVYVIDPQGLIAYSFNNPSPQWLYDAVMRVRKTS